MDWRADQEMSELWDLISMVSDVEDIPVSDIIAACESKGISHELFVEKWNDTCDAAHRIINQAEEKMTHAL